MYISPKSIYIRHLGKFYLHLIGTKSIPAIFLTFRQVIHLGKYTFRQVSLYCEERCLVQPASTFLNQQPIILTAAVENEVLEIVVEPLSKEEVDILW